MYKIKLTINKGQADELIAFFGDSIGAPLTYASREGAEWIIESNQHLGDVHMEVVEIIEKSCHT